MALLKITCTLTGYSPTPEEIQDGYAALADSVPQVAAFNILGEYYGCYGALVNVSVFPHGVEDSVARIVNFEPKTRDLYQASTDDGELLTASAGEVNMDKSGTTTHSTEMGLSHTGKYSSGQTPYGEFEASHSITGQWGQTDTDSSQRAINSTDDRRQRWGNTTYLSQLHNLLTGYHAGTNRATFFLLPRPHVLQPTNRLTFAQGVRVIEVCRSSSSSSPGPRRLMACASR